MALNYIVSYSTGSNGPWTPFNTVTATSDTVTGLAAATAYFFQIIVQDTITGLSGVPVITGPITTTGTATSPNGTTIPSATQILDTALNVWTVSGGVVLENGVMVGTFGSANVILLLWYNGVIYQENNQNLWWSWTGDWTSVAGDPRPAINITMNALPASEINGASFTVSGAITGFSVTPTLNYQNMINGVAGAYQALPAGAVVTASSYSFTNPGITTNNTNNSVSVRDTGLLASVTSSLFSVIAPPSITAVTLNNASFTALANGATVGTISATMSAGVFSGTFSLPSGVVNNANFAISGTNQLVTNVSTMTSGSVYNVNIVATQAGATNSPFTQTNIALTATSGPAIGPAASSTFITADFTNMTSPAGKSNVVVLPQLFGVSSGGFDNQSPNWKWVTNSTFRQRVRALNLPLFRVHSQWQAKGEDISTLINNIGSMVPTTCTMVIGINTASTGQSIAQQWRTGSPVPCTLWEFGNEHGYDQNGINQLSASIRADSTANKIAGDVNAGLSPGQLQSLVNSMNASTLGLLDQHQYLYCRGPDNVPNDAQCCFGSYAGSSQGGVADPNYYRNLMVAVDNAIGSGYGASLPFLMGEYNIECGANSDLRAGTSIGACFLISSLIGMQEGTNRPIWGAIWDLMDDGGAAYNLIDGSFNLYPQYYTLQRLIATMPGNMVNTVSGNTGGGVKAWATKSGTGYGVAIINSNDSDKPGTVALSHWPVNSNGNGTATLWTYPTSPGYTGGVGGTSDGVGTVRNTPGTVTTINVTAGVTQSITVPAKSCVILST